MKIAVIVENSSWYGRQIIDGVAAYAQTERDWSLVWSNPRNPSFESRLAGCQGVIARITTDDMARKPTGSSGATLGWMSLAVSSADHGSIGLNADWMENGTCGSMRRTTR